MFEGKDRARNDGFRAQACSRLQTCEAPVRSVTKIEDECLQGVPWRKWRWPAVAHCKGGC